MLDARLTTISNMVKRGMVVADVGCDHAYLAIDLIKRKVAKRVYACDISDGPLNQAKKNIIANKLENEIIVCKSDGLLDVPFDVTCLIIAGMGFFTVKSILTNSLARLVDLDQIIVQVNSDVDLFRTWLNDNNFTILNEEMIKVKHYYTIIEFSYKKHEPYSDIDILLGPILKKKASPIYIDYLNHRLNKLESIKSGVTNSNKINHLNKEIEIIQEYLKKDGR